MIGSHDTFTYLDSKFYIYNHFTKWWRTQCKSIEEQYAFGVRFFDIRVYLDSDNHWRYCHGIVNLNKYERTLNDICLYMENYFPEAIYRIVLEKGKYDDEMIFIKEAQGLCSKFPNLWRVDIKASKVWMGEVDNNNDALFNAGYKFAIVNTWEFPAFELHGKVTVNNFSWTDLKKKAQTINYILGFKNPQELKNMINSKDELYFIDYCTNEY